MRRAETDLQRIAYVFRDRKGPLCPDGVNIVPSARRFVRQNMTYEQDAVTNVEFLDKS